MSVFDDEDLEDIEDAEEEEDVVSKEEKLRTYMAALGFRPALDSASPNTIEFFKNYTDTSNKVGRVRVIVEKDEVGIDPKKVQFFALTMQTVVQATEEDVRRRAPAFCNTDLLRILAHFGDDTAHRDLDKVECQLCGILTAEFATYQNNKVCIDCGRRKGLV